MGLVLKYAIAFVVAVALKIASPETTIDVGVIAGGAGVGMTGIRLLVLIPQYCDHDGCKLSP